MKVLQRVEVPLCIGASVRIKEASAILSIVRCGQAVVYLTPGMHSLLGQMATVVRLNPHNPGIVKGPVHTVSLSIDGGKYVWPVEWLKRI